MGLMSEFKDFAVKGNAIDMAVGIIIGGAFGKIVSSLVNDVIMPVVGTFTGGVNFTDQFANLGEGTFATLAEAKEAGAPILAYGSFIQNIIDFVIVAFVIFMMVRSINNLKKKEEAKPSAPPEDITLLREIRDSLASGS
ncbi:MAG: large conductance mechanosensitive channel protein MscL [Acidobacteriota bacterium]